MSNENPVTAALAGMLASTHALALKTQNYHWNVEGPHFAALHQLFEGQYEALHAATDDLAERMRALGAYAPAGLAAFAAASAVPDAPEDPPAGLAMVADLADGHRTASAEAGPNVADRRGGRRRGYRRHDDRAHDRARQGSLDALGPSQLSR